MNRTRKALLGSLTVVSAIATIVVVLAFFGRIALTESRVAITVYSAFCILHGLLFWSYYRNVFRNPLIAPRRRDLWTIVLFVGFAFAQLFYFWRYVRTQPAAS